MSLENRLQQLHQAREKIHRELTEIERTKLKQVNEQAAKLKPRLEEAKHKLEKIESTLATFRAAREKGNKANRKAPNKLREELDNLWLEVDSLSQDISKKLGTETSDGVNLPDNINEISQAKPEHSIEEIVHQLELASSIANIAKKKLKDLGIEPALQKEIEDKIAEAEVFKVVDVADANKSFPTVFQDLKDLATKATRFVMEKEKSKTDAEILEKRQEQDRKRQSAQAAKEAEKRAAQAAEQERREKDMKRQASEEVVAREREAAIQGGAGKVIETRRTAGAEVAGARKKNRPERSSGSLGTFGEFIENKGWKKDLEETVAKKVGKYETYRSRTDRDGLAYKAAFNLPFKLGTIDRSNGSIDIKGGKESLMPLKVDGAPEMFVGEMGYNERKGRGEFSVYFYPEGSTDDGNAYKAVVSIEARSSDHGEIHDQKGFTYELNDDDKSGMKTKVELYSPGKHDGNPADVSGDEVGESGLKKQLQEIPRMIQKHMKSLQGQPSSAEVSPATPTKDKPTLERSGRVESEPTGEPSFALWKNKIKKIRGEDGNTEDVPVDQQLDLMFFPKENGAFVHVDRENGKIYTGGEKGGERTQVLADMSIPGVQEFYAEENIYDRDLEKKGKGETALKFYYYPSKDHTTNDDAWTIDVRVEYDLPKDGSRTTWKDRFNWENTSGVIRIVPAKNLADKVNRNEIFTKSISFSNGSAGLAEALPKAKEAMEEMLKNHERIAKEVQEHREKRAETRAANKKAKTEAELITPKTWDEFSEEEKNDVWDKFIIYGKKFTHDKKSREEARKFFDGNLTLKQDLKKDFGIDESDFNTVFDEWWEGLSLTQESKDKKTYKSWDTFSDEEKKAAWKVFEVLAKQVAEGLSKDDALKSITLPVRSAIPGVLANKFGIGPDDIKKVFEEWWNNVIDVKAVNKKDKESEQKMTEEDKETVRRALDIFTDTVNILENEGKSEDELLDILAKDERVRDVLNSNGVHPDDNRRALKDWFDSLAYEDEEEEENGEKTIHNAEDDIANRVEVSLEEKKKAFEWFEKNLRVDISSDSDVYIQLQDNNGNNARGTKEDFMQQLHKAEQKNLPAGMDALGLSGEQVAMAFEEWIEKKQEFDSWAERTRASEAAIDDIKIEDPVEMDDSPVRDHTDTSGMDTRSDHAQAMEAWANEPIAPEHLPKLAFTPNEQQAIREMAELSGDDFEMTDLKANLDKARVAFLEAKEVINDLGGKVRQLFVSGERKAKVKEIYDESLQEYLAARDAYVEGSVLKLYKEHELLLNAEIKELLNLQNKNIGSKIFNGIRKLHDWLGSINLNKGKSQEKIAGQSLVGRVARGFVSVRTAIYAGLAATGAVGVGIKRTFAGVGTAGMTYDLLQRYAREKERSSELLQPITAEELRQQDVGMLGIQKRLQAIEARALLDNQPVEDGPYKELYDTLMAEVERIEREQLPGEQKLNEVLNFLQSADVSAENDILKELQKQQKKHKLIAAGAGVAGAFGLPALFDALGVGEKVNYAVKYWGEQLGLVDKDIPVTAPTSVPEKPGADAISSADAKPDTVTGAALVEAKETGVATAGVEIIRDKEGFSHAILRSIDGQDERGIITRFVEAHKGDSNPSLQRLEDLIDKRGGVDKLGGEDLKLVSGLMADVQFNALDDNFKTILGVNEAGRWGLQWDHTEGEFALVAKDGSAASFEDATYTPKSPLSSVKGDATIESAPKIDAEISKSSVVSQLYKEGLNVKVNNGEGMHSHTGGLQDIKFITNVDGAKTVEAVVDGKRVTGLVLEGDKLVAPKDGDVRWHIDPSQSEKSAISISNEMMKQWRVPSTNGYKVRLPDGRVLDGLFSDRDGNYVPGPKFEYYSTNPETAVHTPITGGNSAPAAPVEAARTAAMPSEQSGQLREGALDRAREVTKIPKEYSFDLDNEVSGARSVYKTLETLPEGVIPEKDRAALWNTAYLVEAHGRMIGNDSTGVRRFVENNFSDSAIRDRALAKVPDIISAQKQAEQILADGVTGKVGDIDVMALRTKLMSVLPEVNYTDPSGGSISEKDLMNSDAREDLSKKIVEETWKNDYFKDLLKEQSATRGATRVSADDFRGSEADVDRSTPADVTPPILRSSP